MLPRPEDGILPLRISEIQGDVLVGFSPDGQEWSIELHCQDEKCIEQKMKIII